MFSALGNNIIFNILEYMVYMNYWIVLVSVILVCMFGLTMSSSLLYFPSTSFNSNIIECLVSSILVLLLVIIISPSFLVLLDYDINLLPSYLLHCTGMQWMWSFEIVTNRFHVCLEHSTVNSDSLLDLHTYMWDISNYLILPRFSTVKFYLSSYDVIHSFGINSFGIKLDTIPAQINLGVTLRILVLGEARGYCYELCGQGHSAMLLNCICL